MYGVVLARYIRMLDFLPDGVCRQLVSALRDVVRGHADTVEVRRNPDTGDWVVRATRETDYRKIRE